MTSLTAQTVSNDVISGILRPLEIRSFLKTCSKPGRSVSAFLELIILRHTDAEIYKRVTINKH